jgi:general secretion pathway protein L
MARLLGIDVSARVARAILVRTQYRKVVLEGLGEVAFETGEGGVPREGAEVAAIRAAVADAQAGRAPGSRTSWAPGGADAGRSNAARPDAVAVALPGDRCFYRLLELPRAAQREIDNVLAFELESTVPFELDGAVWDHRVLKKGPTPELMSLLTAIARTDDVMERVRVVNEAIGREPEMVGPGALPLANLVPLVADLDPAVAAKARLKASAPRRLLFSRKPPGPPAGTPLPLGMAQSEVSDDAPTFVGEAAPAPIQLGPVAIVDLGETRSEVVFLSSGEPVFVRTISRGTAGLNATTAELLSRELRQTVGAFRASGGEQPVAIFLSGGGSSISDADTYLTRELGIPVRRLPLAAIEGVSADQAPRMPHFAKALGLALGLEGGGRGLNLRQGALEASRHYPHLREKLPLLSGLAAVVLVSFGFSVVAEMRSLKAERERLDEHLALVTKEVLGEELKDPDAVREKLKPEAPEDEDPLPGADGFDVMVQLSKSVPADVTHDVVEFDVARGHAVIHGAVPKEADAQATADKIAEGMRKHPCMRDVKIQKVQQFGVDKQKYIMELDVRCREKKAPAKDDKGKKLPAEGAKTDGAEKELP